MTKIGELLKGREDDAPTDEKSDAKQSEQRAISISLFAPDALILASGDADELTINEIFKSVIQTRTVSVDGAAGALIEFTNREIAERLQFYFVCSLEELFLHVARQL